MVAYRERYLKESIESCLENADNPQDIYFSVISEQSKDELHPDLSFVDSEKISYLKLDLSIFRGIVWSRNKAAELGMKFDTHFILWTCGHNMFAPSWDTNSAKEHAKATALSPKAIITSSGPEFTYTESGNKQIDTRRNMVKNMYRPKLTQDYVPGYGFPTYMEDVPDTDSVIPDIYMQWSWVFAPSYYYLEASIDPEMGYHGEEIYYTVIAWARGWRFFATPKVLYYHDTYKEYPGENGSRMASHRPWIDLNQKAFWENSDVALRRLNKLLSGDLHEDVTKEKVMSYCDFSGLNKKYCRPYEDYSKLGLMRHAEELKSHAPYLGE